MSALLAPVVVASGLVVALAAAVLLARRVLLPGGEASVVINGRRTLRAERGEKLLWALAGNGVLLPAACGGRGSCGQCRVVVESGAGEILPVESALIGRRAAAAGERLACMVTVRRDLAVHLPDSAMDAQRLVAVVEAAANVTTLLRELTLALPADAVFDFEAGDYVLVEAPAGETRFADFDIGAPWRDAWTHQDLWRYTAKRREPQVRAYSIASAPSSQGRLQLVVRIALPPADARRGTPPGQVSPWLFGLRPGDTVSLSGPFGDFHARDGDAEMLLVGGGAGIAPLRAMIHDQLENRGTQRRMSFWYGARNEAEICYRDEFDALARRYPNFTWQVALSDPHIGADWTGSRGFIHAVLRDNYLEDHPAPEEAEYYLCGPPLMSAAVVTTLSDLGVPGDRIFYDDFGS